MAKSTYRTRSEWGYLVLGGNDINRLWSIYAIQVWFEFREGFSDTNLGIDGEDGIGGFYEKEVIW
jgi:hypothetical protein